jgi:two-component system, OmpR family, KDP operon response regulator KdpE
MIQSGNRILIVDDEPEIRRFLRASLKVNQYDVLEAHNGSEAIAAVIAHHPDLMILDLGLPDMDGVEVCREIRGWSQIPIIILSVRDREKDKIDALDAGADDYLTKPFGVGELLARIRVVMRRVTTVENGPIYRVGDLFVDLSRHTVTLKDAEIQLTPTEFDLLKVLVMEAGKVITHRQLIHKVWGSAYEDEARLLRVNISNLRRKIEPDLNKPKYIITELGVGYRLKETQDI